MLNKRNIIGLASKHDSKTERSDLASAIKNTRKEQKLLRNTIRIDIHKGKNSQETLKVKVEEFLNQLEILNQEIEKLSPRKIVQILNYFKIQKLKQKITQTQQNIDRLKSAIETNNSSLIHLETSLDQEYSISATNGKLIEQIEYFYDHQEFEWRNKEYDKDDVEKYFSEQYLSKLNLQAWVLLMQRFPSHMLTHVTRQGIRDHHGMLEHHTGSNSFHNGFLRIVQEGKIHNALKLFLGSQLNRESIIDFLHLSQNTKESAIEYVNKITNYSQDYTSRYEDLKALHFASDDVADLYYGAETDNELFFIFPSLLMASKYLFQGDLNIGNGGYHNDKFIWTKDYDGVNINAGVVFIPEKTKVDVETGSRYYLDENKQPILDIEKAKLIEKFVKSIAYKDFLNEDLIEKLNKSRINQSSISYLDEMKAYLGSDVYESRIQTLSEAGITDIRLQKLFFNYDNLLYYFNSRDGLEKNILRVLRNSGLSFKESNNTVESKEYWENYFKLHPDFRPSKIHYYNGDPSYALSDFKEKNNLVKTHSDKDLGYPQNQARDPALKQEMLYFRQMSLDVIQEFYS